MVGKNLSHYKILEELGRGGMGIVYKAEDTKLDRTVAIKVLPSAALASEDDRARFYREAKAAAQLHHPHIASVFEIDEAVSSDAPHGTEPSPFIAMEYIEGKTLDAKIKEGPFKLEDAVRIASEIASALEAAHKKGIVHRDVKSQNVMLTEEGSAKVLDFGLAQTAQSTKLTRMGSTLGTIAYMSPEQARSEEVDLRTDIWSLGVVIYEMISGIHPFPGDYEQAAVYSILNEDPEPLTALRTGVPMELEWLINKCLAKEASARYQSVADLIVDLKAIDVAAYTSSRMSHKAQPPSDSNSITVPEPVVSGSRSKKFLFAASLLSALIVGFAAAIILQRTAEPTELPVMKLQLPLPSGHSPRALDLSPDGQFVTYLTEEGGRPLYRYDLETGVVRLIEGTSQAFDLEISPDGQWLLLANRYSISRISVGGGSPLPVISTVEYADAAWSPGGQSVLYSTGRGLATVSLSTGEERILTRLDSLRGETVHSNPSILPDLQTVMYSIRTNSGVRIGFTDLETGRRIGEISGGMEPVYVETGHILYLDENQTLIALPFDIENLEPLTAPVAVRPNTSAAAWAVSRSGTFLGMGYELSLNSRPLIRYSSPTDADSLDFGDAHHDNMRLSPDGSMLAVQHGLLRERDVWVYDLETGSRVRLTFDGRSYSPSWSPDGARVVYVSGASSIVEVQFDGSASRRLIYSGPGSIDYPSWSPDGNLLSFTMDGDIWLIDDEHGSRPFMTTQTGESQSRFSPNGRYLALVRVVDGFGHVFVHDVDDPSITWDVSQGEGFDPYWSDDGSTLYYRDRTNIMKRTVSTEPTFRILGNPDVWMAFGTTVFDFAVLPDESGIIQAVPLRQESTEILRVDVIVNFFEQLKRLAPHPK